MFTIKLPLFVFLVAGIWLYFDRGSAIRTAVNKAVTQLVAGAELAALNAELVETRRINAWSEKQAADAAKQADAERADRIALEGQLALTANEKKEAADDLASIQALPVTEDCTVGQSLYDRLRNK
ncbi:hypothetical protein NKI96_10830 [Mesorhizobium sp. M0292]|uniref:hypothetical protein n=1 Tax=Mesorhizobium sp. M0292 TaxID=2956929 RepID=UPI00333C30AC